MATTRRWMRPIERAHGTWLLVALSSSIVACEPGGTEAADTGRCATSDCAILDAACASPACGDASLVASDAPDASSEDGGSLEALDAAIDAASDAWVEPPTAELIVEAVSSRDVADRFPFPAPRAIRRAVFG